MFDSADLKERGKGGGRREVGRDGGCERIASEVLLVRLVDDAVWDYARVEVVFYTELRKMNSECALSSEILGFIFFHVSCVLLSNNIIDVCSRRAFHPRASAAGRFFARKAFSHSFHLRERIAPIAAAPAP